MHTTHPAGGLDGFRVMMMWRSRRPFLCILEYRSPGKEPLDHSDAGTKIQFCPWCGANLNEQYGGGTPATGSSSAKQ